jgi:hypothetical protein
MRKSNTPSSTTSCRDVGHRPTSGYPVSYVVFRHGPIACASRCATMRNVKQWRAVAVVVLTVSNPFFLGAAGSLTLRGTVPRRHEITIVLEPSSNAMAVSERMTDVLLATIYERATRPTDCTVTLASERNSPVLSYSLTRRGAIRHVRVSRGCSPGDANEAPLSDTLIITFAAN